MESEKIKLPANVIFVDVAYLNFMIEDIKKYFEKRLERSLQQVDFASFIEFLAYDGGCEAGENEIQSLLIYDSQSTKLYNCVPSDIHAELDGKAFKSDLGEFVFAGVPCEDMVPREDLIIDLLHIVLDSEDTKRVMIVAADKLYDEKLIDILTDVEGKDIIQYRMDESSDRISYRWELLVFPIMQALGISPDEI